MTITIPNPTMIPSATNQSSTKSCQAPVDYSVLRNNNLAKITKYYNDLLDEYTKTYADYAQQNVSVNASDIIYADTTLKPKTELYNTQIINLSKELIDNVNKDTDLILDQKNELDSKSQTIDTLMNEIKLLKEKDMDLSITEKSRIDSLNTTKTSTEELTFTTQIYIGINILLVLLIIGFIIYLVYSNFTSKDNYTTTKINNMSNMNNMNNMNNIYKNIKSNNI